MNAVVGGLAVRSGRTSGSVRYTYARTPKPMPSAPTNHRLTERIRRSAVDGSVATVGAGAASGMGTAIVLFGQSLLERPEQQHDKTRRRAGAHQSDAPDLPGERAKARADLDVEPIEQMHAHARLVDAGRHAHRVERPEPVAFAWKQRQADLLQPIDERPVIPLVARPSRIEPFFFHDGERLGERIDERGRHRVVILPLEPVVLEKPQIEI